VDWFFNHVIGLANAGGFIQVWQPVPLVNKVSVKEAKTLTDGQRWANDFERIVLESLMGFVLNFIRREQRNRGRKTTWNQ
jgi:hypothetical protein